MSKRAKKIIIITIAILVGVFIVLNLLKYVGDFMYEKFSPGEAQREHSDFFGKERKLTKLPSCGDKKVLFTFPPVKPNDFSSIIPLGLLSPSSHTFPTQHIYLFAKWLSDVGPDAGTLRVPVYAPGDITISNIRKLEQTSENSVTDYSIEFSPCQEFHAYFLHLSSLSKKLVENFTEPYEFCNEYDTGGRNYKNCEKQVDIKMKAGEQIGTLGGKNQQAHIDFGAADFRVSPLSFANPKRWDERRGQVVCPLDYFTPEVKQALYNKIGDHSGEVRRTIEPICGQIDQDISGTAQGVWFLKGTTKKTFEEDPHLALVHDNIDPTKGVFSLGTTFAKYGIRSEIYYFIPKNTGLINRDFNQVKSDGNIYCYEAQDRFNPDVRYVMIIEMTDSTSLKIERLNTNSCNSKSWEFSNKTTNFER